MGKCTNEKTVEYFDRVRYDDEPFWLLLRFVFWRIKRLNAKSIFCFKIHHKKPVPWLQRTWRQAVSRFTAHYGLQAHNGQKSTNPGKNAPTVYDLLGVGIGAIWVLEIHCWSPIPSKTHLKCWFQLNWIRLRRWWWCTMTCWMVR